jgi:uncharacterized protein (UPF0276 family)
MVEAKPRCGWVEALPKLGVGLGYRVELHDEILANAGKIDFLEVISEQFIRRSPEVLARADALRARFPIIPHGVELSVGTAAGIVPAYLEQLTAFVDRMDAPWFSDHLAFTRVPSADIAQLTQLWFTRESLDAVVRNVRDIKARIATPLLLENITYYFQLPHAEMTEAEFVTRVLDETDCGMLLDVNNVHINSMNLGFDPYAFLASLPLHRVAQIHLAGGVRVGGMVVDTHSTAVREEVWELLEFVAERAPLKGIILEWDQDFPPFDVLLAHLDRARTVMQAV